MATTTETWKEIIIHKRHQSGFNWFGLFDDSYEIIIKQKLSDDKETRWFNAYIKIKEPLKPKYQFESYRNKNIIGCDTSGAISNSQLTQLALVRQRITAIIEEHHAQE